MVNKVTKETIFKSEVQSLQLQSVYLDELESQYISNQ